MAIRAWLKQHGFQRNALYQAFFQFIAAKWFLAPYFSSQQRRAIVRTGDPVRYGAVSLNIEQIVKQHIPGSLAECGVYTGAMSKFLHERMPDRKLFLFDTFQGFDPRDSNTRNDHRFKDTSVESVLQYIGDRQNIIVRKGFFPETTSGLESERFAFVMIDFDKYEPTRAALDFFYPKMSTGGFVVVHDYSSPESEWACSRALDEFLDDKPEKAILLPDAWGTALFRKI